MKVLMTVAAAVMLTTAGMAQTAHVWNDPSGWWDGHFTYDRNTPKFTGQELSLDLFGSYNNPEGKFTDLFDTNIRHGFWGGGVGLNYFFIKELGIGTDFNISSKPNDDRLVDDVVGNVILRLPIESAGLAPYFIGSGGRGISPIYQWVYGGGVGLEMRFNPTTGIFSDARFLWGHEGTAYNRLLIRVGLRMVF